MSAENHYLDAIEALDSGDREGALEKAYQAVKLDPEHVDAWQLTKKIKHKYKLN